MLKHILGNYAIAFLLLIGGCTVHPPGEREERNAATEAGRSFEKPLEQRAIQPLGENPTAEETVGYAMFANADLEAKYWQWRAAIEQIPQDGTQGTTLNVALGSAITKGRTSSGSSTLTLGNDPMTNIKWPGKLDAAAKIALENARAAGLRFRKAQFELRGKVLDAYYDYAANGELIRLEEGNLQLLESNAMESEARIGSGSGGQGDLLKARTEVDLSKNEIANMKSQLPVEQAMLNALMSRATDAALVVPRWPLEMSSLKENDSEILSIVAERNPELAALASEGRARKDAIRLAKLQYIPDFNLSAGTDLAGITQNILGQATIPALRYEALDGAIAQAQANLRDIEAQRRQMANDLAAQVVLDLSTVRDSERQLELFEQILLPRARQLVELERTVYESGNGSFSDLVESRRAMISIERLVVNLRAGEAKGVYGLESIAAGRLNN